MSTFAQRRREVLNIQKATRAGFSDLAGYAARTGGTIQTCRYNELTGIYCDTMAYIGGRLMMTEQNLQYYPAKIRYVLCP